MKRNKDRDTHKGVSERILSLQVIALSYVALKIEKSNENVSAEFSLYQFVNSSSVKFSEARCHSETQCHRFVSGLVNL